MHRGTRYLRRPRRPPARPVAIAAVVLAGISSLAGCGSSSPAATAAAPGKAYPVTVSNCGTTETYRSEPRRAVTNDVNSTEDMLALGLESRMAGTFGVTGDGPVGQPVPPPPYQAGFKEVRDVSSNYFTLEQLVGLHPDFLFAGWNYGLETGTNLSPKGLARYGIKVLALTESCAHVEPAKTSVSITDTYQDLRNLGAIFDVRTRAQRVIAGLQAQIAAAQAKVKGLKRVTVFDYDSGQSAPFTGPGLAMVNALISLAGGTNIFGSLKQSWTSVSWEQVVAAKPQCIIINDYGTPTAAQKEKFLESFAATKNLPAVKNRCFLPLAYDEVTPGPRNALAVTAIARWLHPAAFGLPADGS
jgi:iron complex transport system substrate-binding protein